MPLPLWNSDIDCLTSGGAVENLLAQSGDLCRLVLGSIEAYAILTVDTEGRITGWNPGAERAFGYESEEIVGAECPVLFDAGPQGGVEPGREFPLPANDDRSESEAWYRKKDGSRFRGRGIITVLRDPKGEVVGHTVVIRVLAGDARVRSSRDAPGPGLAGARGRVARNGDDSAGVSAAAAAESTRGQIGALLDNIPDMAWMKDRDSRFLAVNGAFARAWSLRSPSEVVGRTDFDYVTRERAERYRADDRRVLESGERIAAEEEIPTHDGPGFWAETIKSPLRNAAGEIVGTVGIARDITARKRTEEALRHANDNLQALIHASPLAIVSLDADASVEIWNPAAERIFGWTAEEVRGRPYPAVPEARREEFRRELERAWRGVAVTGLETERLRKDGSRVAVEISTAPLRGPDGRIRGVVALLEDVTERRQAEEARRRLAAILEATPDIVSTADLQGRLLYVNRAGREFHRMADVSVSGRSIPEMHPARHAWKILNEYVPAAIRNGAWCGESALLSPDGGEVPVSQVIIAHRSADGEVEYLSTVIRDITELKRAEEEARQAVAARDRVLGVVSHDLRNPLSLVYMAAQLLMQQIPADESGDANRKRVGMIQRAADQMNRLIQDLLDVVRIEAGELSITPFAEPAAGLMTDAVEALGPLARESGLVLESEPDGELPPVRVDHGRILQVFGNLIGNSAKFTPAGGRILIGGSRTGEEVRFSVSDTGPGISPDQISRVFDRFWQAKKEKGAGLGLSIARGIVEAHGGRIWAESTVGCGATFYFTVPAAVARE